MTILIHTLGVLVTVILGAVSVWGLLTQNIFFVFFSFLLISLLSASASMVLKRSPDLARKIFVLSGLLLFTAVLGVPVLLGYPFLEYFIHPFPLFYIVIAFIFFFISTQIVLPEQAAGEFRSRDVYYYVPKIIGSVLLTMWAIFVFTLYFGSILGQPTTVGLLYQIKTLGQVLIFALALLPLTLLIFTKAKPDDKKLARVQTLGLFTALFLLAISYLFMYVLINIYWISSFFAFTLFVPLLAIVTLLYLKKYPQIAGLIFIGLASLMILTSTLVLIFIQNPNGNYFFSPLFFFSPVIFIFLMLGVQALQFSKQ